MLDLVHVILRIHALAHLLFLLNAIVLAHLEIFVVEKFHQVGLHVGRRLLELLVFGFLVGKHGLCVIVPLRIYLIYHVVFAVMHLMPRHMRMPMVRRAGA